MDKKLENSLLSISLEAANPIMIVLAQFLYFIQPFIPISSRNRLLSMADILEKTVDLNEMTGLLKENKS